MFEFSGSKLLVILVVALVVIGPKDLPRVAYALGAFARKVRLMFDDARRGMDKIVRESGGDEADHLAHSLDHEIDLEIGRGDGKKGGDS